MSPDEAVIDEDRRIGMLGRFQPLFWRMTWKEKIIEALSVLGDKPRSLSEIYIKLNANDKNTQAKVRQVLQQLRDENDAYTVDIGVWVVPHKVKTRILWRIRVARRRALNQCVNCHRTRLPDEDRCPIHKEINRRKAGLFTFKRYYQRADAGLCVSCPGYKVQKPLDGRMQCKDCLIQRIVTNRRRYNREG